MPLLLLSGLFPQDQTGTMHETPGLIFVPEFFSDYSTVFSTTLPIGIAAKRAYSPDIVLPCANISGSIWILCVEFGQRQ